ncbi:MAG: hypothetical protein EB020_16365 [Proteobacteria bacterium]|nr:hypothetical protein [Pseudomonadota bacterium]
MIEISQTAVLALLNQFLWPLLRIAAFLLASPLYSIESFSVRLRIAMAVVLAVFMIDRVEIPMIDPLSGVGLLSVGGEILTAFWIWRP